MYQDENSFALLWFFQESYISFTDLTFLFLGNGIVRVSFHIDENTSDNCVYKLSLPTAFDFIAAIMFKIGSSVVEMKFNLVENKMVRQTRKKFILDKRLSSLN